MKSQHCIHADRTDDKRAHDDCPNPDICTCDCHLDEDWLDRFNAEVELGPEEK